MSGWVSPKNGSGSATTAAAAGASTEPAKPRTRSGRGAVMRSSSPVAIAPALSINVASVAISTTGSFWVGRGVGDAGAGNDPAVRGAGVDVLAGGRLAIFRKVGFQKIALRLGFPLQRPKLNVLAVGRGCQLFNCSRLALRPSTRPPAMRESLSSGGRSCLPLREAGGRDPQAAPSAP